jgi:DNA-binding protein YbaB
MTDSIKDRLAKAIADMQETTKAVARAQDRLSRATATARSRDRSVEVTVDAQGQLSEVKFLDGKYRTMGAAQLAAAVMEAARQSQAEMARMVLDTFQPFSETVGDRPHIEGLGIDWDGIFGPLKDTAERGTSARHGTSDGLRDEIHEDGEKG